MTDIVRKFFLRFSPKPQSQFLPFVLVLEQEKNSKTTLINFYKNLLQITVRDMTVFELVNVSCFFLYRQERCSHRVKIRIFLGRTSLRCLIFIHKDKTRSWDSGQSFCWGSDVFMFHSRFHSPPVLPLTGPHLISPPQPTPTPTPRGCPQPPPPPHHTTPHPGTTSLSIVR